MEFSALALSTLSGLASVQLSSDLALFKQLLVLSTTKVILDGCVVSTAATTLVTATLHRARILVSRLRDQGDVVGGGALELAPVKLIVCSNLCNNVGELLCILFLFLHEAHPLADDGEEAEDPVS